MNVDLVSSIYNKYSKEIYFYIFSISNNKQMAEDIMQEVFMKAICSLPDSHTNIRAWLYKVAKNVYINEMKKGSKTTYLENDNLQGEELTMDESILSSIVKKEKDKVLMKGIMSLQANQRKILMLQYFSELSIREISTVMKLSTENVRVLAHRGKKKLKEFMEANGYEI